MFLQRLQSDNPNLWTVVVQKVQQDENLKVQRDAEDDTLKINSYAVFHLDLEKHVWRPLGVQFGLLPSMDVDPLDLSTSELEAFVEQYDFLQQPWEYRNDLYIVKGTTEILDPRDRTMPKSKYAALFDPRPQFNGLRYSFLYIVCNRITFYK